MIGFHETSPVIEHARVLIERPPEDVFRFVGSEFFINYPRWSPEVCELTQIGCGPVKLGTRARQIRVDLGHRSESIFGVTIFEPNRRICFEGISCHYRCDYQIQGQAEEKPTEICFTFELARLETYLRPFEGMIRFAVGEGVARTVRTLKRLLETERIVSVPAPRRIVPGRPGRLYGAQRSNLMPGGNMA